MLTRKEQRRYLNEKQQQWLRELVVFDQSGDEEALHRLRLGIKKIRALVRLSGTVQGKRHSRELRPLKKMFKKAGMIRDTASQLRLLEQHHLLSPEYKDRQVRRMQAMADNFSRHVEQYHKEGKKAGQQLLADVQTIRNGRIRRWFADEIIRTGVLLTRSGEELHEARKKIKTLLYVLKILPQELAMRLRLDRGYLDELQDAIGKWHDTWVAAFGLPGPDAEGEQQMMRECREKEVAIRVLAADFYCRARRIF